MTNGDNEPMTTVLIVDDEPIVRDVVARYLQRDGFDTLEAGDGDAARELIERSPPHLVVLDVMLPGTDGLSLCRWIRSRGDLPVIMLTARGEEADRIVGLELGADDYVTKPFSPRELSTRVRTVLRRSSPTTDSSAQLSFDGLELDAATREAHLNGQPLRLTAKEFDLLFFLASNPRNVFSRDQIMSRVWGYEAAHDTGTVTVHIRRLRAQDRARSGEPAPARDDLGRRLQVPAVIALALAVAAGTLAVGLAATFALRLLPSVRLQLAGFALLSVVLPLLAVLLSGWVMFHMGDDVKILAVAAAAASAAVAAALVLATSIARRIDRLRSASLALAAGDLGARAPEGGPRELAELGRSFNAMAGSLEGLFDARRELVAAASHDLRAPVASIAAMLEAIEDGLATPEEYLAPLQDQARRLTVLVDDLFELARIDAGALVHELQEVALAPLVESCVRGFEAEARARNVRLERTVDELVPEARCAPEQVERVVLNLLTNALRHTPSDGTVAVTLASAPGHVRVTVEDTGDGLTPEATRRMFDRFWRDDSARQTNGGAGLGLAIARGLVEAQGGTIWAEQRATGGARVSFTLPLAGS